MRIVVLIKSVFDTASVLKVSEDNKSVTTENPKYIMSPYDEYALEEAVQTKESVSGEVVVVSMGDEDTKKILRSALAAGGDRAVLVRDHAVAGLTGRGTAKVLAAVVRSLAPDIVFAGKQAVDDDASQVPERVAELLDISHASVVTRFELGDGRATVDREIEGGHHTLELPLPALVTIQKGINTPRYPTYPDIMKAKRKEIKEMTLADLDLPEEELISGLTVEAMSLPRQERLAKLLDGDVESQVKQLLSLLGEQEKVL
jgi:electron transfer flavoprotein beta subunit